MLGDLGLAVELRDRGNGLDGPGCRELLALHACGSRRARSLPPYLVPVIASIPPLSLGQSSCAVTSPGEPSPVSKAPHDVRASRRVGLRMVEASTPMMLALHQTRLVSISARTQSNTAVWTSWGRRARVRDSQEWSGTSLFPHLQQQELGVATGNPSSATGCPRFLSRYPLFNDSPPVWHTEVGARVAPLGCPHPGRVIGLADRLGEAVEAALDQVFETAGGRR